MKRLFLTFVIGLAALSVNAQVYLGGTVSFKSSDVPAGTDKTTASSFIFTPSLGYTISDMWSIGIDFSYFSGDLFTANAGSIGGFIDATSSTRLNKTVSVFEVAPYVRCTLWKSKMVDFFIDGSIGYSNLDNGTNKTDVFAIGFQPGISLNFNEHLSFVTKLGTTGYGTSKSDEKGSIRMNAFMFELTSLKNIEFGVFYHF